LQNIARRQTRIALIAVFDVEYGPSEQPFFLPPDVKIVAAPNPPDQKNQAKKNAEQKSDDCSLCSFDGFFHGRQRLIAKLRQHGPSAK
jgi:hypothetical protein